MLIALAVLGFISALMMVPVDTGPLASSPHPTTGFEQAVAAFDSLRSREATLVMPDGGSLLYAHGRRMPRAIVLVHGLTNSPRQFRELAEQFHARGYNVIVPRLPLHGQRGADVAVLGTLTAEKLRDYADQSLDIADGLGDTVLVMGLSTGGNVAAWMALHRADVKRIVVIAPAIRLARIPAKLAAPAMNLMDRVPSMTIRQKPDTSRRHAYFGFSTRALAENFRFGASVVEESGREPPAVKELAIVTNGNDRTIDETSALGLASAWRRHDGVSVVTYRFDPALALPHDVIDVSQRCGMPEVVYPVLIGLMEGQPAAPAPSTPARCGAPPMPPGQAGAPPGY